MIRIEKRSARTVGGTGAAVAPGRLFADLACILPASDVEIEYRGEEKVLEVRFGPAE